MIFLRIWSSEYSYYDELPSKPKWCQTVGGRCIWNITKCYFALTQMSKLLCGTELRIDCYLYDEMIAVRIRFQTFFHVIMMCIFVPKWSINYYYMYSYRPFLQKISKCWTAFSSGGGLLKQFRCIILSYDLEAVLLTWVHLNDKQSHDQ